MLGRQVFQVADSIWCVRQPSYLTCSYAVQTPQGVVMIDAGMDSTGADVQALLAAMGERDDAIRAILLTHWHNDHAAGARATQLRTKCPVYYHKDGTPWLTRATAHAGWRDWVAKRIPEWGIGVLLIGLIGEAVPEAVEATDYLSDSQTVLQDFEAIYTPGHVPGHMSFYYRPQRAMFAGDALAVKSREVRFMARPVTLDQQAARDSMKRLLTWDIGLVCPGHREPLTTNVEAECGKMRDYLAAEGKWPLLG
jgi:glyoxylase-like metal-dependent hydrolase (beta-lactamase superfamily II)